MNGRCGRDFAKPGESLEAEKEKDSDPSLIKRLLAAEGELLNTVLDASERVFGMKTLLIIWQRLVSSEGKTCDRCDATYQEMQRAVSKLKEVLRPLGIEPKLEIRAIDEKSFKANPSESNRIWIAGRAIEEWLGARVGSTGCCSVCGESECRTVQVGGTTFEVIPEKLFLKAALAASSQFLDLTQEVPPRNRNFVPFIREQNSVGASTAPDVMRHISVGAGAASQRSGKGGKCGGGMGGQQAGGIKGGGKRKTHAGRRK